MAQDWTWDQAYEEYANTLKSGDITADKIRSLYEPLSKDFADRIVNLHQQIKGRSNTEKWWGGDIGKEDSAWDMAFRLAESGVGSLSDIGQREVPAYFEGENGPVLSGTQPEVFNKNTGEALTNFNRSGFDSQYNLHFTPSGEVIPYTQNETSDWVDFRDAAKMAASTIGMLTPAAPFIAGANALNFAKNGEWEKAILAGLAAAPGVSGMLGAGAETTSALSDANKYAKILKTLEDKDLLSSAMAGANLAGVSEIAGFSTADITKAINMGRAIESGDPFALMKAGSAFLPKGGAPAGAEGEYKPTTDYSVGADYSLGPKTDGLGLKTPASMPDVFNEDGTVNYDLFDYGKFDTGEGYRMPKTPNLESMGGGQGIRVPVEGGYVTEQGFIPSDYSFDLGDPSSYINQPAPGKDVSAAVNKAVAAGNKASEAKTAGAGGVDLMGLMSLLGGQQAGPVAMTVPENAADIKLMQDIFGSSLSAPSTGTEQDKADALARLLRS